MVLNQTKTLSVWMLEHDTHGWGLKETVMCCWPAQRQ